MSLQASLVLNCLRSWSSQLQTATFNDKAEFDILRRAGRKRSSVRNIRSDMGLVTTNPAGSLFHLDFTRFSRQFSTSNLKLLEVHRTQLVEVAVFTDTIVELPFSVAKVRRGTSLTSFNDASPRPSRRPRNTLRQPGIHRPRCREASEGKQPWTRFHRHCERAPTRACRSS